MSSVFSPLCGTFPWPVQIEHAPARMLAKRALLRRIHVWDRHPVWSLHPFLPCCSSVASQPELNIGPLSPNFPSSPSKAFLSSPLCFLSPLSPSYLPPPPLRLPASPFSFSFSFANSPWWGLLGISDEEMENIPQTAQAAVVKGDFHNESLDDPVKESAAGRLCVHPRNAQGARSALCSFIQLGAPYLFRGLPLCCKWTLLLTSRVLPLRGSSQTNPYYHANYLILWPRAETCSSFVISWFTP